MVYGGRKEGRKEITLWGPERKCRSVASGIENRSREEEEEEEGTYIRAHRLPTTGFPPYWVHYGDSRSDWVSFSSAGTHVYRKIICRSAEKEADFFQFSISRQLQETRRTFKRARYESTFF